MNCKIERIGEEKLNNQGCLMKIIEYNNNSDIVVEFQDEYKFTKHTEYKNFKNGKVGNPYFKSVHGLGFIGNTSTVIKNGIHKHSYFIWKSMMDRCYKKLNKYKSYFDCYISDEWLSYESFEKWYKQNYYKVNDEVMCLDKDILVKGNKVYSPETCIFVPQRINKLFVRLINKNRKLPLGVSYDNTCISNPYRAMVCIGNGDGILIGYYSTKEDAFLAYKNKKEKIIKDTANEYKGVIPEKLYNAMMNYIIEITD